MDLRDELREEVQVLDRQRRAVALSFFVGIPAVFACILLTGYVSYELSFRFTSLRVVWLLVGLIVTATIAGLVNPILKMIRVTREYAERRSEFICQYCGIDHLPNRYWIVEFAICPFCGVDLLTGLRRLRITRRTHRPATFLPKIVLIWLSLLTCTVIFLTIYFYIRIGNRLGPEIWILEIVATVFVLTSALTTWLTYKWAEKERRYPKLTCRNCREPFALKTQTESCKCAKCDTELLVPLVAFQG